MKAFYHFTQWSIAYDIKNLRIYFRTSENEKIRYVKMSSFDFSYKAPVKVLDVNADLSGDVSNKFVNYTYKSNRELVGKTIDQPDKVLDNSYHISVLGISIVRIDLCVSFLYTHLANIEVPVT